MAQAASLALAYPEALVVAEATLDEQSAALARGLPTRPLVVGGCCCAHVGAIRGLAARYDRLAVVWLDAHGDLNTPDTSPSGNLWGMPLRMAIDEGSVRASDVALVGARDLDPPEADYVAAQGIDDDVARALEGADAAYVALDVDVLEPGAVPCFMSPAGRRLAGSRSFRISSRPARAEPRASARKPRPPGTRNLIGGEVRLE